MLTCVDVDIALTPSALAIRNAYSISSSWVVLDVHVVAEQLQVDAGVRDLLAHGRERRRRSPICASRASALTAASRCACCSGVSVASAAAAAAPGWRARQLLGVVRHQLHFAEADVDICLDDVVGVHRAEAVGDGADLSTPLMRDVHLGECRERLPREQQRCRRAGKRKPREITPSQDRCSSR